MRFFEEKNGTMLDFARLSTQADDLNWIHLNSGRFICYCLNIVYNVFFLSRLDLDNDENRLRFNR